mgnify:CR=1 FL=1
MALLHLDLPGDLLDAARLTEAELRAELAVHLFEREKLSLGKAAEVAGFDTGRFMHLLGSRNIPMHYDIDEYEADLATIGHVGKP